MMTQKAKIAVEGMTGLIRLVHPPLDRVLCVVHFAPVFRISDVSGAGIAVFQDAIRGAYPSVEMDTAHEVEITTNDDGHIVDDPQVRRHPNWRFFDIERRWRVTLTPQSLALEVDGDYNGRASLLDRFMTLVKELDRVFAPMVYKRMGFRFLNLFQGDRLTNIAKYIKPELLGFVWNGGPFDVISSFNQLHIGPVPRSLIVKHGFMPIGAHSDIRPQQLSEPAWILDMDSTALFGDGLQVEMLEDAASELTDRICNFFGWAITPAVIEDFSHG